MSQHPPPLPGFRLAAKTPPYAGQIYTAQGITIVLGRGQDCHIRLPDSQLSRHHARFSFQRGQWYLEDLGSANGTFINGQMIKSPVPVLAGSVVAFGPHQFLFQLPAAPAAPARRSVKRPRQKRTGKTCLTCGALFTALILCLAGVIFIPPFFGIDLLPEDATIVLDPNSGLPVGVNFGSPQTPINNAPAQLSENGFSVQAEDGAMVAFPPYYGDEGISATLSKTGEASGTETENGRIVSAEYLLEVPQAEKVSSMLHISIPIETTLVEGNEMDGLQPVVFNEKSGNWEPVGTIFEYDASTKMLTFDLPFTKAGNITTSKNGNLLSPSPPNEGGYLAKRVRLQVVDLWLSSWEAVESPASNFRIVYHPDPNQLYGVKSDEWWYSQAGSTGNATDPNVPDYIEDLDVALNQAYAELLQVQQLNGALFQPLSTPITVVVTNTGRAEGTTSITFGTINYSNTRLENWAKMRKVAAHELVHLLQDQYYNAYSASSNLWFFEASAEYLAIRVNQFPENQSGQYLLPQNNQTAYLRVPLMTSDELSFYHAAHFLDWLSKTYGETLIPHTLTLAPYSIINRDDLGYLSTSLTIHGYTEGVEGAYRDYIAYLVSHPEDYGGQNLWLKSHVQALAESGSLSDAQGWLRDAVTYIQLDQNLPPMTTTSIQVEAHNTNAGLLVIAPEGVSGGTLHAYTYDFFDTSNAAYESTPPIDKNMVFPYPASLTISDFGASGSKSTVEQTIVNSHRSQSAQVNLAYYLLLPPKVEYVNEGVVGWTSESLGNIPPEYIQGYDIYEAGTKLNATRVPLPFDGSSPLFNSDQIQAGDSIQIVVVDKFGNEYPPTTPAEPQSAAPARFFIDLQASYHRTQSSGNESDITDGQIYEFLCEFGECVVTGSENQYNFSLPQNHGTTASLTYHPETDTIDVDMYYATGLNGSALTLKIRGLTRSQYHPQVSTDTIKGDYYVEGAATCTYLTEFSQYFYTPASADMAESWENVVLTGCGDRADIFVGVR